METHRIRAAYSQNTAHQVKSETYLPPLLACTRVGGRFSVWFLSLARVLRLENVGQHHSHACLINKWRVLFIYLIYWCQQARRSTKVEGEDDTAVTHSSGRRRQGRPRLSLVYEMRFWDGFEEQEGGDGGAEGSNWSFLGSRVMLMFCVHFLTVCFLSLSLSMFSVQRRVERSQSQLN